MIGLCVAMHALADCASTMYSDPSSLPASPALSKADWPRGAYNIYHTVDELKRDLAENGY